MQNLLSALVVLVFVVVSPACAEQLVSADNLWIRPALKGNNTALYGDFKNISSNDAIYITKIIVPFAEKAVIHNTVYKDGVSKMVHVDKLALPKEVLVSFRPGGMHVMLLNLYQELVPGQQLPVKISYLLNGSATSIEKNYMITVTHP